MLNPEQKSKLSSLFNYLNTNNDFYKQLFLSNNIDVDDDPSNILSSLPLITKSIIKENYNSYISNSQDKKIEEMTSGSTGTPLKCVKSNYERLLATSNIWKQRRLRDPELTLDNYVSLHDIKTYKQIGNFFEFDKENMKKCFDKLCKHSPRWVSGPISTIEKYARLIEEGYISNDTSSIRFIENMGEYADRSQREYVEKVFNCPTINHYGCIESWCIAYECACGNMHVQDDMIYVEAVGKGGKDNLGNVGEIVITSLYNRLMPLIRYNIQDLGTVEYVSCKCGKSSQVINLLGGRTGDMIAGAKQVLGELFFKRGVYKLINKGNDCIEAFKVEQVGLREFIFYSVIKGDEQEIVRQHMLNYSKKGLGEDIKMDFKFVDKIPPLPSGKIKTFYSYVKQN